LPGRLDAENCQRRFTQCAGEAAVPGARRRGSRGVPPPGVFRVSAAMRAELTSTQGLNGFVVAPAAVRTECRGESVPRPLASAGMAKAQAASGRLGASVSRPQGPRGFSDGRYTLALFPLRSPARSISDAFVAAPQNSRGKGIRQTPGITPTWSTGGKLGCAYVGCRRGRTATTAFRRGRANAPAARLRAGRIQIRSKKCGQGRPCRTTWPTVLPQSRRFSGRASRVIGAQQRASPREISEEARRRHGRADGT